MSPHLRLEHPTLSRMARDKGRLLDSSQGEAIAKKCVTLCFPLLFIILWLHVTELQPNFIQMGMNYRIYWGLTEPIMKQDFWNTVESGNGTLELFLLSFLSALLCMFDSHFYLSFYGNSFSAFLIYKVE